VMPSFKWLLLPATLRRRPHLIPGSLSRPADIFIPTWRDRKKMAFDVSVVSPVQSAILDRAVDTPGAALAMRKATKICAHEVCRNQDINFVPLIVETFGGWDKDAVIHLKEMASCMARRTGENPSTAKRHLFQRLSVILQRGNASLLISRDALFLPIVTGAV
jgi:hypothetical protein